jgi:hypothetical protein
MKFFPHSSIKVQDEINSQTSLQRPLHCVQHVKAAERVMSASCTCSMWLLLLWLVNRHMLCTVLGQGQNSNGELPHLHIRCYQDTFLLKVVKNHKAFETQWTDRQTASLYRRCDVQHNSSEKFRSLIICLWGTWWRSWLRHCATSRKVAGSIPNGVTGIFHRHNPSGHTMALGSTQPLTEISTRDISWG